MKTTCARPRCAARNVRESCCTLYYYILRPYKHIFNNNNTCAYVIMSTRVLNYLYDLYCFFMQPRALIKRALVFREQYSHADIMMVHSPTNTRI